MERVRQWVERSRAWEVAVGIVVLFWVVVERVVEGAGMKGLAKEVKAVRGFWDVREKKNQ